MEENLENEPTLYDYAVPVHRVLLQPNVVLGIGIAPAMMILVLTVVLMNLVSVWCFPVGIVLFAAAKILCRNDPYMMTILFERLMQPRLWRTA